MRIFLSAAALLACCDLAAAVGQPGVLQYSFAGKGSAAAIEQLWRRVLTAAAIPGGGTLSAEENAAIEHAVSSFEFRLVKGCASGIGRVPVSLL